jgi:murein DD-endopeptidase MepM/ murein hydrolase activator NlpD
MASTRILEPLRAAATLGARLFSLKNLVAVPAGLLLGFLPLTPGPASSGVLPLPYVPRSAHQAYGYTLAQTGLGRNSLALEWLAVGERALLEPERILAPFDALRSFAATAPAAAGYAFAVKDGQRVRLHAQPATNAGRELFVDVYRSTEHGLEYVTSALPGATGDSAEVRHIEIEALEPAEYVLRVQPALPPASREASTADLAVSVRVQMSPLLAFPVAGVDARAIWSGFGAERDGGARAHRGVDIFAPRGTAALAAMDAWVARVETTRRGGNVVWLQPLFGNMRLYYAHLDEQYVERGQFVLAGEPIGAVGNTGNAITTPAHLHFGVYVRQPGVRGGARDPVAFLR